MTGNDKGTSAVQPATEDNQSLWAHRVAMQVWVILFLLTICVALLKFLIGF